MKRESDEGLLNQLGVVLGKGGLLTAPEDVSRYLSDWRSLYRGAALCVVRPRTTAEVALVVRTLATAGVAIVPQGGNTSLVGGAVPDDSGRQVVLTLERLNKIRAIDTRDMTMVAEAGVVLKIAQEAATDSGQLLPLSLAAEGSATIGGVLATNAGGNTTIRYGNARDMMLGLEVVLASGAIWNGLRPLRKDNTGYALRHLFAGSEGTLGIITAATLRLFAKLLTEEVAFCSVPDVENAIALYRRFRADDESNVRSFEYLSGQAVELVLKHIESVRLPLQAPAEHYVLIDLASSRAEAGLGTMLEAILAEAIEAGEVIDAVIGANVAQRRTLWLLREELSEAQKREGASIKNDVSVPLSRIPELLRRSNDAMQRLVPAVRPAPFGHIGDGNIHLNYVQPPAMPSQNFLLQAAELSGVVNEIVRDLQGSFSAEHGIGQLKKGILAGWHSEVELDLMKRLKRSLDPGLLLNPGKLFENL